MSLVQPLRDGLLDIIGDIHGEYEALISLLLALDYDLEGNHAQNRTLVFVGDLCDRGPDSPRVLELVKRLITNGKAQMVLGNHEINILQAKAKDGAGWYFKERENKDKNYEPFARVTEDQRHTLFHFLSQQPLALENEHLRIVHATWDNEQIDKLRQIPLGQVVNAYKDIEAGINHEVLVSGLREAYENERKHWDEENPHIRPPFLEATSRYNMIHQMNNPLRIVTSGVEERAKEQFYTSGKWRFVERYTWWDRYTDDKPVVVGHFWRKWSDDEMLNNGSENIFENIQPTQWHGVRHNVFCVDFSVGARFKERNAGIEPGENTKLIAMRWPEKELVLETGEVLSTENYLNASKTTMKNKK